MALACAPEPVDEPAPLEFPWKNALARYANCEVTALVYPEGSSRVGYEYRRTYNALGLSTSWEFYDHAYKDGDLAGKSTVTYDDLGRWLAVDGYDTTTGEISYHEEATWEGLDIVRSDAADATYTYTVDELHRVLQWSGDDAPFDGVSDGIAVWEYHEGNTRGLGSWDSSYDGVWQADYSATLVNGEVIQENTVTYDDAGHAVAVVHDSYGDRGLHIERALSYDAAGREARVDSVCQAPCWSWDWSTTEYEWSCPGG